MTTYSEILDAPEKQDNIKLFAPWQIVLVGCFSSIFFASLLLSYNIYKIGGNNRKIVGITLYGLLASFRTVYFYGYDDYILFSCTVVFQFIGSYALAYPIWNKNIVKNLSYIQHKSVLLIPLIIAFFGYEYMSGRPHWYIIASFYQLLINLFS